MNASDATAGQSPSVPRAPAIDTLDPRDTGKDDAVTRLVGDGAAATRPGRDRGVTTGASSHTDGVRATRARTSRSRLLSWLVVWDALVPVGLLILAGRFEGAFGPP